MIAFVRPPSDSLVRCELTHLERAPIDPKQAREQHRGYVRALEEALRGRRTLTPGVLPPSRVVRLPGRPELPDAVFVEDVAVAVGSAVVLGRPGVASRRPEVDDVRSAAALAGARIVGEIEAPGTLEGGDVLALRYDGRTVLFVGLSTRTNREGAEQLRGLLAEARPSSGTTAEPELVTVPVRACLHLKTAASSVGSGTVLLNPRWVDSDLFDRFEVVEVPEDEPLAGNILAIGETVLVSDRWPATRRLLERRGLRTVPLDLRELEKAEAGPSCMCVLVGG